jgi:hypothetical protein
MYEYLHLIVSITYLSLKPLMLLHSRNLYDHLIGYLASLGIVILGQECTILACA